MRISLPILLISLTAACSDTDPATAGADPADVLLSKLSAHCGKAYEGKLVSSDEADAAFAQEPLVMHVRDCSEGEIRIPFHVGENRSRTWVITRTTEGLRLKHEHRHEDGEENAVSQYGGDSATVTTLRAEFPVDQYSIEMFTREGLTASVTNIWAIEITEDIFAYELKRENRFFRVEFDVTKPIAPPAMTAMPVEAL